MRDSALKPSYFMFLLSLTTRRRRAHARQRFETQTSEFQCLRIEKVGEELMRDSALKQTDLLI